MGSNSPVMDSLIVKELRAEKFGLAIDPTAVGSSFTVTNHTAGLSLNCNANDDLLTADTLGSLIAELIAKGLITGTVA